MCLLKYDHKVFLKEYITFKLIQRNETELEKKFKKSNQKKTGKNNNKKSRTHKQLKMNPNTSVTTINVNGQKI